MAASISMSLSGIHIRSKLKLQCPKTCNNLSFAMRHMRRTFCICTTKSQFQRSFPAPRTSPDILPVLSCKLSPFRLRGQSLSPLYPAYLKCGRPFSSCSSDAEHRTRSSSDKRKRKFVYLFATGLATLGMVIVKYAMSKDKDDVPMLMSTFSVHADAHDQEHSSVSEVPYFPPIRKISVPTDDSGLKLTLFQYQTCPFCCKVRAYLDFCGFSYDVIEVNSVSHKQTKWSKYKRVPVLVVQQPGQEGFVQLNDSTAIISSLESFLVDRSKSLSEINTYYPSFENKGKFGRVSFDCPNKYFIMFGDNGKAGPQHRVREEREWREWVDNVLVHTLSPNVYRTPSEALQAFRWFAEYGEWDKVFSGWQQFMIIYVGSAVMLLLGKMLKRKYKLHDDVRQSLYDNADEWTRQLAGRDFLGGDKPDLADLAAYGVLKAIEGCDAFGDMRANTEIGPWFDRMKAEVENRRGGLIR